MMYLVAFSTLCLSQHSVESQMFCSCEHGLGFKQMFDYRVLKRRQTIRYLMLHF